MSGKHLVVMVALGAAIGVGAARAGTPFGGDDTGGCRRAVEARGARLSDTIGLHYFVASA